MALKPIEFRQLCVLLRAELQRDPSIDDAEWKARTLDTLAQWSFQAPKPEQLGRAMSAVEQALKETVGPRPIRQAPRPPTVTQAPRVELPKEARTSNPPGWHLVAQLMATLQRSTARVSVAPTGPSETLPIDEVTALNEFWQAAWRDGANRLELVRAFAEVAILRPADWDYAAVRAKAQVRAARASVGLIPHKLSAAAGCFVCRRGSSQWHHIIQIQFGGSNSVRNFVSLCASCHGAIHPWLSTPARAGGWHHLTDCMGDLVDTIENRQRA